MSAPVYNPGTGPYNYPQITISNPIAPPPQPLTNVPSLLQGNLAGVMLFLNGLLLTSGTDYTISGPQVTMIQVPQPGDTLTAQVFLLGNQLGGSTPRRYVAPIVFSVSGAYNGINTLYLIQTGPTIFGACDGVNNLFTWSILFKRVQVYRNGVLQTNGVDIGNGPTAVVFMPGALPQTGDILVIYGW